MQSAVLPNYDVMTRVAAELTGSADTGQEYTDRLIGLVDDALHDDSDHSMIVDAASESTAFANFVDMVIPPDAAAVVGSFHAALEAHFGPGVKVTNRKVKGRSQVEVAADPSST